MSPSHRPPHPLGGNHLQPISGLPPLEAVGFPLLHDDEPRKGRRTKRKKRGAKKKRSMVRPERIKESQCPPGSGLEAPVYPREP
jgi:hypothetical protein